MDDELNGAKWDPEWELRKSQRRFMDIMDEIDAINKKIKSMRGQIYRLQQQLKGRVEDYLEEHQRSLAVDDGELREPAQDTIIKRALAKYYDEIL